MDTVLSNDIRELRGLVANLNQTAADLRTLGTELENHWRIATETVANFRSISSPPRTTIVAARGLARRLAALKPRPEPR